jgi:hypothetical protein
MIQYKRYSVILSFGYSDEWVMVEAPSELSAFSTAMKGRHIKGGGQLRSRVESRESDGRRTFIIENGPKSRPSFKGRVSELADYEGRMSQFIRAA